MRYGEIFLPQNVIEAFHNLGNLQRGNPEMAMLRIQHLMGGGVLNPLVEHAGDLTHRMTHLIPKTGLPDTINDKCTKCLRYLLSSYGFEREFINNIKTNAEFRTRNGNKITEEELKEKLNKALKIYSIEHQKLPVYNYTQWIAREIPIQIGKQIWWRAIDYLSKLEELSSNNERYNKAILEYELDDDGNPKLFNL